ncbi:MAG: hypothetical protein LBB39_02150 [Mycoplasmataceae bacterium]|jgi:hypothetical protein|nr:hypothetical protein [Mycoplasmataceae bacterium]
MEDFDKIYNMEIVWKEPLTEEEQAFFDRSCQFWKVFKHTDDKYYSRFTSNPKGALFEVTVECESNMISIIRKAESWFISYGKYYTSLIAEWKRDGIIKITKNSNKIDEHYRYLSFDLDTKDPNFNCDMYIEFRKFMIMNGFNPMKDNNYLSKNKVSERELGKLDNKICLLFPQMIKCCKKFEWTVWEQELLNDD